MSLAGFETRTYFMFVRHSQPALTCGLGDSVVSRMLPGGSIVPLFCRYEQDVLYDGAIVIAGQWRRRPSH